MVWFCDVFFFFFQAEDGIRDAQESRGLGDVYKRQLSLLVVKVILIFLLVVQVRLMIWLNHSGYTTPITCLLYTSDAADDLLCVDLGGRRIIKKKKQTQEYINTITETHTRQS